MSTKPINWHWPRTELAKKYLRMFQTVGAHSMVLFAPRGKGKTEFMTRDVIPEADRQGFFPVYVNFWDDNQNPSASLRYAMLRAAEEAGFIVKLKDFFKRSQLEVSAGVKLGIADLDLRHKTEGREREEAAHFAMRYTLDGLIKLTGKPILFVFDEVQTLASKPEHEHFVRSLRTMLDERKGKVHSIFTGSSQTRLTELFSRLRAPLYNFAQPLPFPQLGDDFLRHWAENIQRALGKDAEQGPGIVRMRKAFAATDCNPRVFFSAVLAMIQDDSTDIERYTSAAVAETADNAGVRQRLAELAPLDKLVLGQVLEATKRVREGKPDTSSAVFAKESRDRMSRVMGLTPTPSQIQASLRRLMGDGIQLVVSKASNSYEIEDSFFLQLIEESLLHDLDPAKPTQYELPLPQPGEALQETAVARERVRG